MRKILLGLLVTGAVGGVAFYATNAFFSDTETSTGNTFQAGSIDLKIDNTSYYNGVYNPNTSWLQMRDLSEELFFDFFDLKPGDYGEDTISLHVDNNNSWLCADVTLTNNNDNGCVEPELNPVDTDCTVETPVPSVTPTPADDGELADQVNFIWWADDGDNVLEADETPIHTNVNLGALNLNGTATVALADSTQTIWGTTPAPLPGNSTRYIGKGWCFGTINLLPTPIPQDGGPIGAPPSNGPDQRGAGFTCDGAAGITNAAQSDLLMADISFRAVQSRNNPDFRCANP